MVRKKAAAKKNEVYEKRTSWLEDCARCFPAGKPLHEWPNDPVEGFNEYDKKWYYCGCLHLHVLAVMLFFIIFTLAAAAVQIGVYICTAINHSMYIFVAFILVSFYDCAAPIIVICILQKIRPSLCSLVSCLLVISIVLRIVGALVWIIILCLEIGKVKWIRKAPLNMGLVYWSYFFLIALELSLAILYFFTRSWLIRLQTYLNEKRAVLSNRPSTTT